MEDNTPIPEEQNAPVVEQAPVEGEPIVETPPVEPEKTQDDPYTEIAGTEDIPPSEREYPGDVVVENPMQPADVFHPMADHPDLNNPQAPINDAVTAHAKNPGDGNPAELHPITDDDYVSHPNSGYDPTSMQEHAEQTRDKGGRPAGYNEFYHGDHMAKPENELIYQMPSDLYYANANRENR